MPASLRGVDARKIRSVAGDLATIGDVSLWPLAARDLSALRERSPRGRWRCTLLQVLVMDLDGVTGKCGEPGRLGYDEVSKLCREGPFFVQVVAREGCFGACAVANLASRVASRFSRRRSTSHRLAKSAS